MLRFYCGHCTYRDRNAGHVPCEGEVSPVRCRCLGRWRWGTILSDDVSTEEQRNSFKPQEGTWFRLRGSSFQFLLNHVPYGNTATEKSSWRMFSLAIRENSATSQTVSFLFFLKLSLWNQAMGNDDKCSETELFLQRCDSRVSFFQHQQLATLGDVITWKCLFILRNYKIAL